MDSGRTDIRETNDRVSFFSCSSTTGPHSLAMRLGARPDLAHHISIIFQSNRSNDDDDHWDDKLRFQLDLRYDWRVCTCVENERWVEKVWAMTVCVYVRVFICACLSWEASDVNEIDGQIQYNRHNYWMTEIRYVQIWHRTWICNLDVYKLGAFGVYWV